MGKSEINVRHKPGKDRVSNASHTTEDNFQAQVRKVVELTKCSSDDAAYVLTENEYSVDQAVLAILDQPDVNVWKENKKKTKNEARDKETSRRSGPPANRRESGSVPDRRGGGGGYRDAADGSRPGGGGRPRGGGPTTGSGGAPARGPRDIRGGGGGGPRFNINNNGQTAKDAEHSSNKDGGKSVGDFPEIDSFSISTYTKQDDDLNWKKGPLVFESSVPPSSVSGVGANSASGGNAPTVSAGAFSMSVYESTTSTIIAAAPTTTTPTTEEPKKLSFAAVTAKGKKPPPPPPQPQAQPVAPPASAYQNHTNNSTTVSSADFSSTTGGGQVDAGSAANSSSQHQQPAVSSSLLSAEPDTSQSQQHHSTVDGLDAKRPASSRAPASVSSEYNTSDSLVNDASSAQFAPLPTSSAAPSMNVNREFTDKLKNDIGIGLHHASSESPTSSPQNRNAVHSQASYQKNSPILDFISNPALHSSQPTHSSFSQGVEFLTGGSPQAAVDFQFGFQQLDISAPHASVMDRFQQQPQSPPRGAALSFTDPSSLEYQSHDSRQPANLADSLMSGGGKPNGTGHLSQQSLQSQHVLPSQQQQSTVQQQHALNLQQQHSLAQQQQAPQLHHHQPSQQQNSSSSLQQQHSALSQPAAQQQQPTPQQQAAAAAAVAQPPQSTQQHSLQQQQQQMYTATAQFPSYFPYHLYSPVAANMRDVDQYTATALPFPYMGQLDPLQLNAMLPPSLTAAGNGGGNLQAGSAPNGGGLNSGSSAGGNSSNQPQQQNHHQLSQQASQPASVQQLQQHRAGANDNKFQSQLQSGGNSSNNGGLPTLAGNVPFQNLGSASQQPGGHQNRNQSGGGGLMNNSSTTGNSGVAPPPGFNTPHFVPQQSLQSLFHMPSYPTHTPMPFPMLFPGGPQQQQPSQQRQPQLPQNHHSQQQHMLQSQNHHQPQQQQRHGGGGGMSMDHVSFMDMSKYPQPNSGGNSNSNLQGLASAPFHGAAAAFGMNSGGQGQQQPLPLHRNQSLNQGNAEW